MSTPPNAPSCGSPNSPSVQTPTPMTKDELHIHTLKEIQRYSGYISESLRVMNAAFSILYPKNRSHSSAAEALLLTEYAKAVETLRWLNARLTIALKELAEETGSTTRLLGDEP
jgi:hypothetical protein